MADLTNRAPVTEDVLRHYNRVPEYPVTEESDREEVIVGRAIVFVLVLLLVRRLV